MSDVHTTILKILSKSKNALTFKDLRARCHQSMKGKLTSDAFNKAITSLLKDEKILKASDSISPKYRINKAVKSSKPAPKANPIEESEDSSESEVGDTPELSIQKGKEEESEEEQCDADEDDEPETSDLSLDELDIKVKERITKAALINKLMENHCGDCEGVISMWGVEGVLGQIYGDYVAEKGLMKVKRGESVIGTLARRMVSKQTKTFYELFNFFRSKNHESVNINKALVTGLKKGWLKKGKHVPVEETTYYRIE